MCSPADDEHIYNVKDQAQEMRRHKRHGAKSVVSTSSTIPLEEIKRRVALEAFRNKEKV